MIALERLEENSIIMTNCSGDRTAKNRSNEGKQSYSLPCLGFLLNYCRFKVLLTHNHRREEILRFWSLRTPHVLVSMTHDEEKRTELSVRTGKAYTGPESSWSTDGSSHLSQRWADCNKPATASISDVVLEHKISLFTSSAREILRSVSLSITRRLMHSKE